MITLTIRPNAWVVALTLTMLSSGTSAAVWAAERAWQTGTWRDMQVERPKIVYGVGSRDPNGVRLPPRVREIRTYVIETADLRLELKETTTADAPRIDAMVGEPVTFALDKNTLYIKEGGGKERKLSVTKKIVRPKPASLAMTSNLGAAGRQTPRPAPRG
jgi:hypothetical protein